MGRPLQSDAQFERAMRAKCSVYARRRRGDAPDVLGALEAFNPVYVTLAGNRLYRGDYIFIAKPPG